MATSGTSPGPVPGGQFPPRRATAFSTRREELPEGVKHGGPGLPADRDTPGTVRHPGEARTAVLRVLGAVMLVHERLEGARFVGGDDDTPDDSQPRAQRSSPPPGGQLSARIAARSESGLSPISAASPSRRSATHRPCPSTPKT